jgi:hypothetical protein
MLYLNTNITKDIIESVVSPVDIMSVYLDIDRETILNCIEYNTKINSPFRADDDNASCGFAYNNKGRLKCRDFGGAFFGDCYDVAAYTISFIIGKPVNVANKQDFIFVLRHIETAFASLFTGNATNMSHVNRITDAAKKFSRYRTVIEFTPRPYDKADAKVWGKWGINLNYLSTNYVYPVEYFWLNRHVNPQYKYAYKPSDPCYAYVVGVNSRKETLIQLYFPLRAKNDVKFITNNGSINGLLTLTDNYDFIVICKSVKDRLALNNYIDDAHLSTPPFSTGGQSKPKIGYVNIPSESHQLSDKEHAYLKSKLKPESGIIVSFMDFDATGRRCAKHMKDRYNIPYFFITNGQFGLDNYGAKDFAELRAKYPLNTIKQWTSILLNEIWQ